MIAYQVKMGGVGIRSQGEINPTAFIGGLEQALPHFIVAGGVCQQLAGVTGDGQGQYYSQAAGHAGSFFKPRPCFKGRPHRGLSTWDKN